MSNKIAAERTGISLQSERYWVGRSPMAAPVSHLADAGLQAVRRRAPLFWS